MLGSSGEAPEPPVPEASAAEAPAEAALETPKQIEVGG